MTLQASASCLSLPGRLRASRRIPAARPFPRSNDRVEMGRRSAFTSPRLLKRNNHPFGWLLQLEVGGVEPPSPGAYRKRLQVYPTYRVVEAGAANRRAFPPVSRV